jgi:DNA-directed RNA polymerase specialized sigma24 family protein
MKTSNRKTSMIQSTRSFQSPRSLTPEQEHKRQFEELVVRASRGDSTAVTAIYIAFRPVILEEARRQLGPYADEAEDVLQEMLVFLLEGRWPYVPAHGRASKWICRVARAFAHRHRADREREWNGPA